VASASFVFGYSGETDYNEDNELLEIKVAEQQQLSTEQPVASTEAAV